MGKDCKYCGAYIADGYAVCPACGKKVRAEKASETSYDAGSNKAAGYASAPEQENGGFEQRRYSGTYTPPGTAPKTGEYRSSRAGSAAYTNRQTGEYRYNYKYNYEYGNKQKKEEQHGSYTAYTVYDAEKTDAEQNKMLSYLCYFGPLFLIPYLTKKDSDFVKFHSNQGLMLLIAAIIVNSMDWLPFIGWLISAVGGIFVLVGFINGLINVSRGQKKPLPGLSDYRILK